MEAPAMMNQEAMLGILPYSKIIGQKTLKLALELAFIAPKIGGVLISGQRGTGKSTAARAFAHMMSGNLPITLPINATEDRVIGGWKIDELMRSNPEPQPGLLEDANGKLLYIDEVNLLDDHIVNIILDVTSTGVLVIQREGRNEPPKPIQFTLVGTMNPEEGGLRPQLLDRFGLMVSVISETEPLIRGQILQTVLDFDAALFQAQQGKTTPWLKEANDQDKNYRDLLIKAKDSFFAVNLSAHRIQQCIAVASAFQAEGHRGDYVMALAARALAALEGATQVTTKHIQTVAPLALHHRRQGGSDQTWKSTDESLLESTLKNA
jgi:magnesium chelatase subunit I